MFVTETFVHGFSTNLLGNVFLLYSEKELQNDILYFVMFKVDNMNDSSNYNQAIMQKTIEI